MASFAQIDENNVVVNIIKVSTEEILDENGNENEELGIKLCKLHAGETSRWVQTWYGEDQKRVRNAQIGGLYVEEIDAFMPPKIYPSWVLNKDSASWIPPKPSPQDVQFGYYCYWNEEIMDWTVEKVDDPENLPQPEDPAPEGKEYFWNYDSWAWDIRDKPAADVTVDVQSEEVTNTAILEPTVQ